MHPQLVDYIKQAKQQGVSDEQIKQNLLSSGWSDQDIKTAMETSQNPIPLPPNIKQKSNTTLKVVIFAIIFLALAGGAYTFYIKQKIATPIQSQTENPTVKETTTPITSDTLSTKDCNSVSSDSIFPGKSLTTIEDTNYSCFISQASICSPTKISFTGSPGSIEVIGKDANYCTIQLKDQVQGSHTCKLSMNDLSFYAKPIGSTKSDPSVPDTWPTRARSLIFLVSFGTAGWEGTNDATGKPIDISCTKNG